VKALYTIAVLAALTSGASYGAEHKPKIHTYSAAAGGAFSNAYLVETAKGVVAVDATLTVSDATALRKKLSALKKPLRAILLTHTHPDHYNGAKILKGDSDAPIVATAAVDAVIRRDDASKAAQWSSTFGAHWPAQRAFPDRILQDGETITFDGVSFAVHDLGPGESHADAYWIVSAGSERYAFIGDVVLNRVHAYVTDGHTTEWLVNLDKLEAALQGVTAVYPGHGASGDLEMLTWQRNYLIEYRATVQSLQRGGSIGTEQKAQLSRHMHAFLPNERLEFAIELGADAVAAELHRSPSVGVFESIKAKVGAENTPFALTVRMKIKQGTAAQFATVFAPAIAFARQEQGCLAYDLNQSVDDRDGFVLYERWSSLEALRNHMLSGEYRRLLDSVGSVLAKLEVDVLAPYAE
jgi:glyoxylase-like metal-dependent hydrolase (beta-lactamase superfamily II)/quinol monooxygenase YgiN